MTEYLYVYPNPFAAFDRDGHPCGVCPRAPDADAGGPAQFVGARLDRERTVALQDFGENAPHELRSPMQSTKYSYLGIASSDPHLAVKLLAKEPVRLPRTKFYRDRIAEGALLPVDQATANAGRLRRFLPPRERLQQYLAPPAAPAELEPTPGMAPPPTSPDAEGNVLEAPALAEGGTREVVDAPADGSVTSIDTTDPAPEAVATKPSKSKRQETSS